MNDPYLPPGRSRSDLDGDPPPARPRDPQPWRPPMERIGEFLDEDSPRAHRFIDDFLNEYGREFIDDLFAGYLDGVGSNYRQKLIEFAARRGIIDGEGLGLGLRPGAAMQKPPKEYAPSIKPQAAGDEKQHRQDQQQRSA